MKTKMGSLGFFKAWLLSLWIGSGLAFSSPGAFAQDAIKRPDLPSIPVPYQAYSHLKKVRVMSLRDAILLSLRYNITVRNSELDRITQKYQVAIARNQFEPQYNLTGSANYASHNKPIYSLTPQVSLLNTYGTGVSLNTANTIGPGGQTINMGSVAITQPLIRGSGRDIVLINLRNTLDGDVQNRLALKRQLMQTITDVIGLYYVALQNYNLLKVDQHSLDKSEKNLKDVKLRVELGKRPLSDLTRQEGDIAGQRLDYEASLLRARDALQDLLRLIGLDPDAKLDIDKRINLELMPVPDLEESIQIALKHNPDYLSALIQLRIQERLLIQAKDSKRWQLNLTAQAAKPLWHNQTGDQIIPATRTAVLSLQVPVDNLSIDQAIANAKVGLQKQKFTIREVKQTLIKNVINAIRNIQTARSQIEIAEVNYRFKQKVYENSLLSWQHGKTTYFQVIQDQTDWRDAGITLVNNKIAYISLLSALDNLLGITLDRWGITVDY